MQAVFEVIEVVGVYLVVAADVLLVEAFAEFVHAVVCAVDEYGAGLVVLVVDVHFAFHEVDAQPVPEIGGVVIVAAVA